MARPSSRANKPTQKLRHQIANELNAIVMTIEALPAVREDAKQFDELIALLQENLEALRNSAKSLLDVQDVTL